MQSRSRDIHDAEFGEHGVGDIVRGLTAGKIASRDDGLAAIAPNVLGDSVGAMGIASMYRDACTFCRDDLGDGLAYARTAARHQTGFALQLHVHAYQALDEITVGCDTVTDRRMDDPPSHQRCADADPVESTIPPS